MKPRKGSTPFTINLDGRLYETLAKHPLMVNMLATKDGCLVVRARRRSRPPRPSLLRAQVILTQAQSDDAFCGLASLLGYEVPHSYTKRSAVAFRNRAKWPVRFLSIRGGRTCIMNTCLATKTRGLVMFEVALTRRVALSILRTLAPILGWELTEE